MKSPLFGSIIFSGGQICMVQLIVTLCKPGFLKRFFGTSLTLSVRGSCPVPCRVFSSIPWILNGDNQKCLPVLSRGPWWGGGSTPAENHWLTSLLSLLSADSQCTPQTHPIFSLRGSRARHESIILIKVRFKKNYFPVVVSFQDYFVLVLGVQPSG